MVKCKVFTERVEVNTSDKRMSEVHVEKGGRTGRCCCKQIHGIVQDAAPSAWNECAHGA